MRLWQVLENILWCGGPCHVGEEGRQQQQHACTHGTQQYDHICMHDDGMHACMMMHECMMMHACMIVHICHDMLYSLTAMQKKGLRMSVRPDARIPDAMFVPYIRSVRDP